MKIKGTTVGTNMSVDRVAKRLPIDATLKVSGAPADAKAVGDKIEAVSEAAVVAVNESLAKKVNKVTKVGEGTWFYGVSNQGEQTMYAGASGVYPQTVALRGAGGVLSVGTPTLDTHAVTKKYVDDNAIEVYRASYDVYTNELNGNFADLKNAFDSGKIVMLTCDTPVGNVWSFCCDGYETANYGTIGEECLVFHSCSTESIRTIYVCADGTIQEKFVNIGDIDAALDRIIEIQNSLIGGE